MDKCNIIEKRVGLHSSNRIGSGSAESKPPLAARCTNIGDVRIITC
jgi:hypothetical protein